MFWATLSLPLKVMTSQKFLRLRYPVLGSSLRRTRKKHYLVLLPIQGLFEGPVDEDVIINDLERIQVPAESLHALSVERPDIMQTLVPPPEAVAMEDLILNQPRPDRPLISSLNSFIPRINDIPVHSLNDLFENCPNSDLNTLSYLHNIQSDIRKSYVPMNSIHSDQSILFYEHVLKANSLVLNTLRFGYRPGFQ